MATRRPHHASCHPRASGDPGKPIAEMLIGAGKIIRHADIQSAVATGIALTAPLPSAGFPRAREWHREASA